MPPEKHPIKNEHVIVLLEDMQSKFGLMVEIRDSLRTGMDRLHEEVADVRRELQETRDDLKTRIEDVNTDLKARIEGVRTELKADIAGVRTELKVEIAGVSAELKEEIVSGDARTREELGAKIDAIAADLAAHRADTESHAGRGYNVAEQ